MSGDVRAVCRRLGWLQRQRAVIKLLASGPSFHFPPQTRHEEQGCRLPESAHQIRIMYCILSLDQHDMVGNARSHVNLYMLCPTHTQVERGFTYQNCLLLPTLA
jgi:hypothetical protein